MSARASCDIGDRASHAVAPPPPGSLSDRWFGLRNRLLASPAFQRWAVRFPFTRPIANRRARALFDITAGFVYSQVLVACVRLRLFDILAEGPQSIDHLADRLSISVDNTAKLLTAAASLRLAEHRRDGRFGLGVLGAAMPGNPGIAAMVEHHAALYTDLRDPLALLRGEQPDTALGRLWPYADRARASILQAEEVANYSRLMAASQPLVAADVLAAYRLDRHRCLMDLGGGDGSFLIQAASAAPALHLMLFDLPAVAEQASVRLAEAGLNGRCQTFGGDARIEPLPTGADIMSIIRIIHDHDDDIALAILRTAWQALPPNGTLLLAEPMAETAGAEAVGAYFSFYLLAMGSGRPRTAEELSGLLAQAGFVQIRLVRTRRPMLVRVITATKPAA